jgi:hypothetical protein
VGLAILWRRGVAALPVSHVAQYPFSGPLDVWKASGGVCSGKSLKPLLWPSLRVCGVCGAAGIALAIPLLSLSVSRPVGCLASFSFLLPGLSAGCASGLGSWLLPLAPPLWIPSFVFRVGLPVRLALGRRWAVGLFGGPLLRLARAFFYIRLYKDYRIAFCDITF